MSWEDINAGGTGTARRRLMRVRGPFGSLIDFNNKTNYHKFSQSLDAVSSLPTKVAELPKVRKLSGSDLKYVEDLLREDKKEEKTEKKDGLDERLDSFVSHYAKRPNYEEDVVRTFDTLTVQNLEKCKVSVLFDEIFEGPVKLRGGETKSNVSIENLIDDLQIMKQKLPQDSENPFKKYYANEQMGETAKRNSGSFPIRLIDRSIKVTPKGIKTDKKYESVYNERLSSRLDKDKKLLERSHEFLNEKTIGKKCSEKIMEETERRKKEFLNKNANDTRRVTKNANDQKTLTERLDSSIEQYIRSTSARTNRREGSGQKIFRITSFNKPRAGLNKTFSKSVSLTEGRRSFADYNRTASEPNGVAGHGNSCGRVKILINNFEGRRSEGNVTVS